MPKHVSEAEIRKVKNGHLEGSAKGGGGKGCVTKCFEGDSKTDHHGNYRNNGYNAQTTAKKALYQPNLTAWKKMRLKPRSERKLGAAAGTKSRIADPAVPPGWTFSGENYRNANKPFAHNYHHILPWDSLANALKQNELIVLQKTGYNLNEGFNLMILPCFVPIAKILRMYTHPNNHPAYNDDLMAMLTLAKDCIIGDEDHLDELTAPTLRTLLENFEKGEFMQLVAGGRKRYGEHVNVHPLTNLLELLGNIFS